jgi:hypothetical protein
MGYGATRTLEPMAAAMGALQAAPIVFESARDIPQGGVLLSLSALLVVGLLRYSAQLYSLPAGFYGLTSVFLLLALLALARIPSLEQLRYQAAGEWGNLLGLDRVPEVRTLREKVKLLCAELGRAARWNTALAQEWITQQSEQQPGLVSLEQPLSESAIQLYEQHQGHWQGRIEQLKPALDQLQKKRKQTPRQIPVKDLPEQDRFTRLRTERKRFLDTIKMIAYRAETSMASTAREKLARSDDARALLRQIYNTEVDLIADPNAKTLTVCLHHLTQAAHDAAVRYLCEELTATETTFPGTDLRLLYKLGSA